MCKSSQPLVWTAVSTFGLVLPYVCNHIFKQKDVCIDIIYLLLLSLILVSKYLQIFDNYVFIQIW